MAKSSTKDPPLRPPRHSPEQEAWKTAPSRETTHDAPDGRNARIERQRKPLENAPGTAPDKGEDDT
jgi:hypothetical protein